MRASITYTGMDAVKPAAIRQAVKELLQQECSNWHDNFLPRHFGRGAKQRYGYKDRTKKYDARKRKIYGHTRELELTGELKKQVLRKARISGTSKRATATMDAPRYLYQYKPNQPDKAAELTTVTQAEANALAISLDKNLQTRLNADTKTHTVTL